VVNSESGAESSNVLIGRLVLGRYRIVRPIARGGMGVVYLGRVEGAAGFSKPVVIKSVLPAFGGGNDGERLFAREARIVANLQHPGIVAVIDFGKVDTAYVMVLEYVHGYHLGQWLRFVTEARKRVPTPFAVHPALCVLDALNFAHSLTRPDGSSLGIIHRDVSTGNVLIDIQGQVKLSDFGIARMADEEFKTQEGIFRGTLAFCAPEAVQGAHPSRQMDQYGAAVVLYQLLAGRNPFIGNDLPETLHRVLTHDPPPLSSLRDDVPVQIDRAIARALQKKPEERFPSVADFARAIRAGCTWSEREQAELFAAQVAIDFGGQEMADRLGLEPLPLRDAAWREVQDPVRQVPLSSSPPQIKDEVLRRDRATIPVRGASTSRTLPVADATPAQRRNPVSLIVLAVAAVAAGLVAAITLLARQPGAPAPKLVVIEKEQASSNEAPSNEATIPTSAVKTQQEKTTEPVAALPSSSATSLAIRRPATSATAEPGRGVLLARSFQRQEGKIQSCFRDHPESIEGEPHISVRFQVSASGAVQNALVSPSSVASTALGACIVSVARSTDFGPQPEPISFAIPIAARVVHH
jgi:eukaryotic-like serine/threonine-protein kinase